MKRPHTRSRRNVLTSRPRKLHFLFLLMLGLSLLILSAWLPMGMRTGASTGQAAARQGGQAVGGSSGQAVRDRQARPSAATPSATLTDHRMTGTEPAGNCVAPVVKSSFAPTDTRAYQWTLVSGAVAGDVISWDFRQPNGTSYFQTNPVNVTINGNVCFWAFINITGFPAASLLGPWEVRVTYNGALLTTDTFTIRTDTVTLTDHRITGIAPNSCTPPPSKTSFLSTDPSVYQWTLVSAAHAGDTVRWEFVQPNSSVYATSSTLTLTGDGDRCFWVSIDIAGQPAAPLLGTWQVRVIYNDVPLLPTPDTFTIASAQNCPSVSNVNPTSGAVGSNLTITGTNFTGVTAVKFASNVAATFTVNNATTISATVPSGAITGPITLSKSGCADVQASSFSVLLQPVIEVTPPTLNFGNVATGDRVTLGLMLRNIGNASLSISSITISNPQFAISSPVTAFGLIGSSIRARPNSSRSQSTSDPLQIRSFLSSTELGFEIESISRRSPEPSAERRRVLCTRDLRRDSSASTRSIFCSQGRSLGAARCSSR